MGWVDGFMIGYSLNQDDNQRDIKLLKRVAEEWLNITISPKYQVDNIVHFWSAFPTNLNAKSLLTPEEITSLPLNNLSYFDDNLIPLPTLTRRQRNGMKMIWEKALETKH